MRVAALLLGYAAALGVLGSAWLVRTSWTSRAPRLGIWGWQVLSASVVVSATLAGLVADAVVASLVLCTIADVPRALAEAARVLRPGGRLFFYEHIRSADPRFARKQRIVNVTWPLVGGGCRLTRDSEQAIRDAGFTIERARHFDFVVKGRTLPGAPCVIGVARKPVSATMAPETGTEAEG
ncbi:class I SAM-dependent methyltransferase [Streptomyces canus]|uniref:class I SAM-dependent methyltransferase n=1 Tax=Streptomyces canus TaxID=58343 RepID=UPI0037FED82E